MWLYDEGKKSKTDIVVLCKDICGANLSIGYYNEHTTTEILSYREWLKTYKKVEKMLSNEQLQYKTKEQNIQTFMIQKNTAEELIM